MYCMTTSSNNLSVPNHLFKQLDSLVKTKKHLSREYIEENWVGSYIIKRFITFTSNDISFLNNLLPYINNLDCSNISGNWGEYLFLLHTLPRIKNANFYYIKKSDKNKKDGDDKKIEFISESLEISKKESKYLIDNKYIDIKL